jgi:hypothetical protein
MLLPSCNFLAADRNIATFSLKSARSKAIISMFFAHKPTTGNLLFSAFEIYVISTTSGQPTGLVLSGNLDSGGFFSTSVNVSGSPYWFPVPQTNTFQLYQADPGGGLVALNTWSISSSL